MAPRTPVDIDNPSWGDWLRGNIKYGERKAADFNDWWATRTTNDKLADREVFLDQMRKDPRANNGLEAFISGARTNMDKGGFFGPAFKSTFMPDPAPPEAMRKMDYAYGQMHPVEHLAGAGVGATISAADGAMSYLATKGLLGLGKSGLGWLGGRLGLGSAVEAGPIGAWTNASTGARAAPSAAAQAASWLGNTGRSAGSAVASKLPVTTALVTKGGPFAAATTASALGLNGLMNYIDGVPAQHEAAREERAAAEQAAAQDQAQTQANKPDPLDVTIAQFLDGDGPSDARMRFEANPNDPNLRAAVEREARARAADTRTAREAIAVGAALGLDPETTLTMVKHGQFTNRFINTMMGLQAQNPARPMSLKDALGAQQMQAIAAIRAEAAQMPQGKERQARETLADQMLKELMQMAMTPNAYVPPLDDQQDQ